MIKLLLLSDFHSRTTPHTSPLRASYGVSFVSYTKKNDRDISRAHCNYSSLHQPVNHWKLSSVPSLFLHEMINQFTGIFLIPHVSSVKHFDNIFARCADLDFIAWSFYCCTRENYTSHWFFTMFTVCILAWKPAAKYDRKEIWLDDSDLTKEHVQIFVTNDSLCRFDIMR